MQSHLGNITLAGLGEAQTQEEPSFWENMQSSMKQLIQPVMDVIPGVVVPEMKEQAGKILPTTTDVPIQKITTSPIRVTDPNVRAPASVEESSGGIGKGALIVGGVAAVGIVAFLMARKKRR